MENEIFWFFENQLLDHGETKDKFFKQLHVKASAGVKGYSFSYRRLRFDSMCSKICFTIFRIANFLEKFGNV